MKELLIKTDRRFLEILKCDISFESAYKITKRFLGVKHISYINNGIDSKAQLIKIVELYLQRHGHLDPADRPIFLNQKSLEFSISDLYNHEKDLIVDKT